MTKKRVWHMRGITNCLGAQGKPALVKPGQRNLAEHYVLFLDYDEKLLAAVRSEVKFLRGYAARHLHIALPTFWVIETRKNHYWAICFGQFTPAQVLELMWASSCDPDYFRAFKIFGCNTIRLTPKKTPNTGTLKLASLMPAEGSIPVSVAHTRLFEIIFKAKDPAANTLMYSSVQIVDYGMKL